MAVSAPDAETLERIVEGLPPGWARAPADVAPEGVKWRFGVARDDTLGFRVRDGDGQVTRVGEIEVAIGLLTTYLRRFVGYHAPDLVFVHAGVVRHEGRAIVIPGHSFSGKSTLVAALVRAGAVYYSDEYALVGEDGLVRPYREQPVLRDQEGLRKPAVTIEELGGVSGDEPVPVALVVITTYTPAAEWNPARLSPAQGLLALMEHTVPARDRPQQTLGVLRQALEGAVVLQGERGDADRTAESILATRFG
jgi:hypothetical protein